VLATAPGKLILTGEYAVLDGAPALVLAVNRRVIAKRRAGACGSSAFLLAILGEIEKRYGREHPAAKAAAEIIVDSTPFYEGATKLGLGSSAAVSVAATALALAANHQAMPVIDRELVLSIASAAHATAQSARAGQQARGSGADIAAAVYGGVIAFQRTTPDRVAWPSDAAAAGRAIRVDGATVDRLTWPAGVTLIPFFTGAAADTTSLVSAVHEARERDRAAVDAALHAIDKASRAACQSCAMRASEIASNALISALSLAAQAVDQLAAATGLPLVPSGVTQARSAMARLGGTAKTTGAGGGDIAVAVVPGAEDATVAMRYLIEAGCKPLQLAVDKTGVDLQPDAQ
jgi:phosphomevalonate kinase